MKNNRGEIATLITIGTLVVIGISTLVSSVFLKNKQTTQSKAQEACSCEADSCSGGCTNAGDDCFADPNVCLPIATPNSSQQSSSVDLTTACKCTNGKPAGDCPVNPCGGIPEKGAAPDDDPSCSSWGKWGNRCTGTAENCPSDAGVAYTYWCDGTNWRFQYPNCVTWCKPEYIAKPPSTKDPLCQNLSAGGAITNFSGDLPAGVIKGSSVTPKALSNTYVSCDGNVGTWVDIHPFCDQFGQVAWGPGEATNAVCNPPAQNPTITPPANSSFYVTVDVNVAGTGKGADFDTTVNLWSSNCDGDASVTANGVNNGYFAWNRGANSIGQWVKMPRPGGKVSLGFGQSGGFSYTGRIDNCPRSKTTLQSTVTCDFGVSPYGAPWVRGSGCTLTNADEAAKITLQTKAQGTTKPVDWGKPPVPKNPGSSLVFSGGNAGGKTQCENNGGKCASYIGGDKGAACSDNFGDFIYDKSLTCSSGSICCKPKSAVSTATPATIEKAGAPSGGSEETKVPVTTTCTNYAPGAGFSPGQSVGKVACGNAPGSTYTESCSAKDAYVGEAVWREAYSGTRYVSVGCGNPSDPKTSCNFKCAKVDELNSTNYTGDCKHDDTCINPGQSGSSTFNVRVDSIIDQATCKNDASLTSVSAEITDPNPSGTFKPIQTKLVDPAQSKLNLNNTFTYTVNKAPSRDITINAFVYFTYKGKNSAVRAEKPVSKNSIGIGDQELTVNIVCNQ